MPKRTDISKILIIGSGPIIIGQSAEFDYSGTQAFKGLISRCFGISSFGEVRRMMKIALVSAYFFASAAYAVVACPVNDMQAQKSSRYVQITAQASPLKGTQIEFYSYKLGTPISLDASTLHFSSVTDEEGKIKTSELPPGLYLVLANGAHDGFAQLVINVLPDSTAQITSFTMYLCADPRPSWTPAAEKMPIKARVSVFRGIVKDQLGAVIPSAWIDIVKKGTEGKEHVAKLKASLDGSFSAELPPGLYIAFFYNPGFKDEIVPFEVAKEGTGSIDVILNVPSTTQVITRLDLPNNAQTH
jgi:hypothetical protein